MLSMPPHLSGPWFLIYSIDKQVCLYTFFLTLYYIKKKKFTHESWENSVIKPVSKIINISYFIYTALIPPVFPADIFKATLDIITFYL